MPSAVPPSDPKDPLRVLYHRPPVRLSPGRFFHGTAFVAAAGACASSLLIVPRDPIDGVAPPIAFAPAALVAALATLVWYSAHAWSSARKLRAASALVSAAAEDLRRVGVWLDEYVRALDHRTSRYFHCVTNSKITAYYILVRVRNAVEERLSLVGPLLESGTADGCREAAALLRAEMVLRNDVLGGKSATTTVHPRRLGKAVALLVEDLEAGLASLEGQLRSAAESYNSPGAGRPDARRGDHPDHRRLS